MTAPPASARTLLDLLVTEQDLLTAQVSEIIAQHDVLTASLQLQANIGKLDALTLPVTVFDPTRHYRDVKNKWGGENTPH